MPKFSLGRRVITRKQILSLFLTLGFLSYSFLPAFSASVKLPEGTQVRLQLQEKISLGTGTEGQQVHFTVAEDVLSADQKTVLVSSGAPGLAYLSVADTAERQLALSFEKIRAIDGSHIPIRGSLKKTGSGYSWNKAAVATILVGVFALPVLPFFKGKKPQIPSGTIVNVFTDRDAWINITPAAESKTLSQSVKKEQKEPNP